MFIQILVNGLITGLLYALVALGFNLIYRSTQVFHIAHGAIYTAAAYFFFLWISQFSGTELSLWLLLLGIVFALLGTSLLTIIFEKIVYYPLFTKKAPTLVTFISSLGVYIVVVNLIALFFGNETKILNPSIEPSLTFGDVIVTRIQIIQVAISILLIAMVFFLLKATTLGKNIRALSDNPVLASVVGLKVKRIRMMAFLIGSALAAVASLLIAYDVGMDPYVGLSAVLTAAVAFIIGGTHSYAGSVLGALMLGLTQNLVVWFYSAQWQDAVTFVVLILVLLFRQEGLFMQQIRVEER